MSRLAMAKSIAFVAILLAGCSPIYTSYEFDSEADFSSYTTYSWMEHPVMETTTAESDKQYVPERVKGNIDKNLADKGLKAIEDGGDLLVVYTLNPKHATEVVGKTWGAADMWSKSVVGGSDATITEITEGKLTIFLLDDETKIIVWQGTAENAMKSDSSDDDIKNAIDKAVAKLFEEYPPN